MKLRHLILGRTTMTKLVCMHVHCFSRVWLFMTPWTIACQVPLSMGYSRWEYLSGLPCPPPMGHGRASSYPGVKPMTPASHALQGDFFFFFLPLYLFFNWRIIALQNFVVFCQTSTRISHRYTHAGEFLTTEPPRKPMSHHSIKQRHHLADKGPYSQNYGFFSSYVHMCEFDH